MHNLLSSGFLLSRSTYTPYYIRPTHAHIHTLPSCRFSFLRTCTPCCTYHPSSHSAPYTLLSSPASHSAALHTRLLSSRFSLYAHAYLTVIRFSTHAHDIHTYYGRQLLIYTHMHTLLAILRVNEHVYAVDGGGT